ncbi:hypothetical protein LWI28_027611 [Acer negundo]|uniref:Uncharacterized protein n=1 Tax=Acer negundo TaxID=4023 RepID=A0AAD5JSM1_ACENE|nr:hypothetical protein LWI28_027611 [Acer negundo]
MPPKRRADSNPRENPIDEVYERDVIAQLRQQVETLAQQIAALTTQKWRPNPEEVEEESNHSLFFNDDYVSESVIIDFDKPPIFYEEMSDDDLESSETVVSCEYISQGLTSFHHVAGVDKHVSLYDDVYSHVSEFAYVTEHINHSILKCLGMSAIRRDVLTQSAKEADGA